MIENKFNTLQLDFLNALSQINVPELFQQLFNTFPTAAAILNSNREIVFTNRFLLNQYGFKSVEEMLGRKPGEVLGCIHTLEGNACGTLESCKVCGAYQSISKSIEKKETVTSEFLLISHKNGGIQTQDFKITSQPIKLESNIYIVLYLLDITHEKRRVSLERIFFHDILNKMGSLSGFFELMVPENNIDRIKELMMISRGVLKDVTEEILMQRQLAAAESGELKVVFSKVNINLLINKLIVVFRDFQFLNKVEFIYIDHVQSDVLVNTDEIILNRVLTNIIKNAVEASNNNDVISIFTYQENQIFKITVSNNAYIEPENQTRIFKRSFSTKGEGRGLGTYGIKMLTENYLKGKASFTSDPTNGTTFMIELKID